MAMNDARRPTTTFSASTTIHFFSISDGFSEAVVWVCMGRALEAKGALVAAAARAVNSALPAR
jgi:hypothetical protein